MLRLIYECLERPSNIDIMLLKQIIGNVIQCNDTAEVKGLLMGLISSDYIKGKIHFAKNSLILKKDSPFVALEYEPFEEDK